MRLGGRRIDWTMDEVAYLLDNAGRVPQRELCRHLRRSSESVRQMAKHLREQGHAISLRHFEPRTAVCPACGRESATLRDPDNRTGFCRPCQLRMQIRATDGAISDLLGRLPAGERATYEETESVLGGRAVDPMPGRPRYAKQPTYYERMRAEEAYAIAVEQWEVRRLTREARAKQKRKERIMRKLRDLRKNPNQ